MCIEVNSKLEVSNKNTNTVNNHTCHPESNFMSIVVVTNLIEAVITNKVANPRMP